MRVVAILVVYVILVSVGVLAFASWKYSGKGYQRITGFIEDEILLSDGSRWNVYYLDNHRVHGWRIGDKIKLISSRGFYYYDWLMLNLTAEDAVHVKCVEDQTWGTK